MNEQEYTNRIVKGVLKELTKPQNLDLLMSVASMNAEGGFMFGFARPPALNFDEFADLTHQLDAWLCENFNIDNPTINMSQAYDDYLKRLDDKALNEKQTARFDQIVAPFDDGWSGAVFGLMMRLVQREAKRLVMG